MSLQEIIGCKNTTQKKNWLKSLCPQWMWKDNNTFWSNTWQSKTKTSNDLNSKGREGRRLALPHTGRDTMPVLTCQWSSDHQNKQIYILQGIHYFTNHRKLMISFSFSWPSRKNVFLGLKVLQVASLPKGLQNAHEILPETNPKFLETIPEDYHPTTSLAWHNYQSLSS